MKLEFKRFDLRLKDTWTLARTGGTNQVSTVIVKLTEGNGVVGVGEAAPSERYGESAETVESFLGRVDPSRLNPSNAAATADYLRALSPGNISAKCAINIALTDICASLAKLPIYDWLELGFRECTHVTTFTIGIDSPEMIRRKVAAAEEYPLLKLKVGVPGDPQNLRALREVAPRKLVRVDANEGWATKEEALERITWLAEDGRIEFVEQPMPASKPVQDWIWLKERSPLPIFGDESYHTAQDVFRAADCFHGVNIKLVKAGGILGALEALRAARKAGLKTMLGSMIETSVLITAAAHLAALCDYLDLDGNLLIGNDPYIGVRVKEGFLSFGNVPRQVGLGVCER